jgi:hypothetical protein
MVKAQVLQKLQAVSSGTTTDIGGIIIITTQHILYKHNWL